MDCGLAYSDGDIDDAPREFGIVSSDSGGATIYTGTVGNSSFDVTVPDGAPKPIINSVDEKRVRNAMTETELKEMSRVDVFAVPLDIRFENSTENDIVTFRFRNTSGLTNEKLIVKSTTPSGVIKWNTPVLNPAKNGSYNAHIEDGKWIVLSIGVEGTVPSFADLRGSVTIAGSKAKGNSDGCRNSSGGCSVGALAPAALLLLIPLMLTAGR